MIDGGYVCNRCNSFSTYPHKETDCLRVFEARSKKLTNMLRIAESFVDPSRLDEMVSKYKELEV